MADEVWKPVREANHILVSNFGRVMNANTGKVLKGRPIKTGYLRVHLPVKNGKRSDAYIHRLVADAFCFHPEGYDVVNHIDFDNTNNRADNLEWTTQKSNILHSMDVGRYPNSKTPVRVLGEKDGIKYLFHSAHDAAKATNCDEKTILRSCKLGKRTSKGYLWKKVG